MTASSFPRGFWLGPGLSEHGHSPPPPPPRSFAKPPKQVQTVCECILIMKGYKELNWKTAKGMMSDPNFLRSLMEIDFDSITQGQVKNIKGEWGLGGSRRASGGAAVSPDPCTWTGQWLSSSHW